MYKRGLGMPLPCDNHQDIIYFLFKNLEKNLPKRARPFLRQNRTADDVKGKNEIVPDISLFKKMYFDKEKSCWQYSDIVLNIEVVNNNGTKYSKESIEKLFKRCDSLQEAFLYNYESHIWVCYSRLNDFEPEESDYSRLLRLHLNDLAQVGETFEDVLRLY